MATITQNLQRLVDAKSAIATAITNKGGTVNSGDGFEEFPADIATIPGAPPVYTYHINPNESDPSAAVTYMDDAVGMTPAKMGSTSFDYGSWGNAFFMPKPCVLNRSTGTVDYYLDPDDYTKKVDGTDATITTSNTTGYVMIEFPKIWVKRVAGSTEGERTVSIAPYNMDGTYQCFSYINNSNKETNHFYIAAYDVVTRNVTPWGSKARSLSGITLNSTNAPDYNSGFSSATNNGTGWHAATWSDYCLIYDLLVLMGKSLDLQSTYGNGITSGGQSAKESYVTGTLNDKGLFYGDVSGTSTAVKVFGMENFWGLRAKSIAGLMIHNNSTYTGAVYVKMTSGTYDGSTATSYSTTSSTGYLSYGYWEYTYGGSYVKTMVCDSVRGYKVSNASNATSGTYYCDWDYGAPSYTNDVSIASIGGCASGGTKCGFDINLAVKTSGSASWAVGPSLSYRA